MNDNTLGFKYNRITWKKDGIPLFFGGKLNFTLEDKAILKNLLSKNIIPTSYLPNLWFIASGARRQMDNNPQYYDSLLNDYPYYIPSAYETLIELDLPRTFPFESYFQNKHNIKKLKNVLIAYSRRNVTVGYCQGFNFIIGKLLMIFDSEEKVFWIFAQLIEEYFSPDYFTQIIGVILDSKVIFDHLVKKLSDLNEINEFIIKNNIPVWLICIFVNKTNDDTLYLIWNGLFLDGMGSLLTSIVFLISNFQAKIDLDSSFSCYSDYYNNELLSFNRLDELRDQLFNKPLLITPRTIDKLRQSNRLSIYSEYNKKKAINNNGKNSYINESKCNSDWPLCIYDVKYRYDIPEIFVYQTLEKPIVIDDFYFEDCGKETGHETKYDEIKKVLIDPIVIQVKLYSNLVIERRKHNCNSKDHFTYDVYKIITCEEKSKEEYSEKLLESFQSTKSEIKYSTESCALKQEEAIDLWKELDKRIEITNIEEDKQKENEEAKMNFVMKDNDD